MNIPAPVVETSTADVQVDNDGRTEQVNEYRIAELLGVGAFAKVFRAEKTGQNGETLTFAVKIFNKSLLKRKREFKKENGKMVMSNAFQKVQKEVAIMKKLSHMNVIKLYEVNIETCLY